MLGRKISNTNELWCIGENIGDSVPYMQYYKSSHGSEKHHMPPKFLASHELEIPNNMMKPSQTGIQRP